jgi:uncharacterized protein
MSNLGAGAQLPEHARSTGLNAALLVVPMYVTAIAAAEVAGVLFGAVVGAICHAILIPLLLSQYVLMERAPYRRILPALALAPLLRILSLNLATPTIPWLYWHALIGAPLLVAIGMTARLLGLTPAQLGLSTRGWQWQLLIGLSGPPLGIVAVRLVHPAPFPSGYTWSEIAAGSAILLVFNGFAEELLFRGLLQQVASELYGSAGVLYSSAVFAALYLGALSWSYALFIFLVGLLFGWCARRTGAIWGVALAHGLLTITLLLT